MEAALRSRPRKEDDSILQIRGNRIRPSIVSLNENRNKGEEEVLCLHGSVEEIFAIDRSNETTERSRCVIPCNGTRTHVIGSNGSVICDTLTKKASVIKKVDKHDEYRNEALERATLEVWEYLIPQLELELKRILRDKKSDGYIESE